MKTRLVTIPRESNETIFSMLFNFLAEHLDEDRTAEPFQIDFSEDYYEELINAQKTILPTWNGYDKKKVVKAQLEILAELINEKLEICYGLRVVKNLHKRYQCDDWVLIFYEPLIKYTPG